MNQEKKGRLIFRTQGEFYESFANLVKSGGHIFVDGALTIKILTARMYSQTGTSAVHSALNHCNDLDRERTAAQALHI
ncbi:hypothetical protein Pcinc_016766 [Petrolisthes cinctipes]|uniref:Uncharacterized protein n=1 Tax=Petrolisthes cinctipes TaxID=88211 RepID=A0AAE1KQN9_PETCI|nr:hypothetical protein Pcinc_024249 [Petrolisthes cinctipes]KAK3878635.1 hypothetical protein Pcinc_016766 [Petrolisthes cinctipes]